MASATNSVSYLPAEIPVSFRLRPGKVPTAVRLISGPLDHHKDRLIAAAKTAWEAEGNCRATATWARFEYKNFLWKVTHPSTYAFRITAVQDLSLEPCCGCDELYPDDSMEECGTCAWTFCKDCLDKDKHCADCRD